MESLELVWKFETGSLSCLETGRGFGVVWLAFDTESDVYMVWFECGIRRATIRSLEACVGVLLL